MALIEQQYIDSILLELNVENDARLTYAVTLYWDLHADKGPTALQYLYAKRSLIDALLGGSWDDVTVGTGSVTGATAMSDQVKHLQILRQNVELEIKRLNGRLVVSSATAPASVFITAAADEFG